LHLKLVDRIVSEKINYHRNLSEAEQEQIFQKFFLCSYSLITSSKNQSKLALYSKRLLKCVTAFLENIREDIIGRNTI